MHEVDGKTAKELAEQLLEVTGNALLSGDFDSFAPVFHLPHSFETGDGKIQVHTREELREVFQNVRRNLDSKGVSEMIRLCKAAEFRNQNRFEYTHVSHYTAGNRRVNDPFPAFSVVERIDGHWKVTSSAYAVDSQTAEGRALNRFQGGEGSSRHEPSTQNKDIKSETNDD